MCFPGSMYFEKTCVFGETCILQVPCILGCTQKAIFCVMVPMVVIMVVIIMVIFFSAVVVSPFCLFGVGYPLAATPRKKTTYTLRHK